MVLQTCPQIKKMNNGTQKMSRYYYSILFFGQVKVIFTKDRQECPEYLPQKPSLLFFVFIFLNPPLPFIEAEC